MEANPIKIDMLNGKLFGKIIAFSIPLIASGMLQQSFNSVDIAIVGQFSTKQALAAVGSNGLIISLIINLFVGISVGANVVISNYIGQHDNKGIKNAVNTTSTIALCSGLFLFALCYIIAKPLLKLLDTPDDVIDLATRYLRIYSIGMPFMMIYNFGSAILRSVGDTKRPLYSLIVAGIINVILNLILVIKFDMGVTGVAIATLISNIVSAIIILYILIKEQEPFKVSTRKLTISGNELNKILKIGLPAGLQGMVFSISNVFILSAINRMGSDVVAGSSTALNFEYYCYFVINAFGQAAVAFISQNYGSGYHQRCKQIYKQCMFMSIICCGALNLFLVWQKGFFVSLFTTNPDVTNFAYIRMEYVLLFQFIASSYEISGAAMRGLGYSMTPTVLTIFGTCILRILWVSTICRTYTDFNILVSIYPISWIVTGVSVCIAYYIISKKLLTNKKDCPLRTVP